MFGTGGRLVRLCRLTTEPLKFALRCRRRLGGRVRARARRWRCRWWGRKASCRRGRPTSRATLAMRVVSKTCRTVGLSVRVRLILAASRRKLPKPSRRARATRRRKVLIRATLRSCRGRRGYLKVLITCWRPSSEWPPHWCLSGVRSAPRCVYARCADDCAAYCYVYVDVVLPPGDGYGAHCS